VDSYLTRNSADIDTRLIDTFSSSATNRAHISILNNYTRGTWFGTAKTNFPAASNWVATNTIYGGVLKKLQFVGGDGGVVRCYDSRSTTTAQKCKFAETGFVDFLDTDLAPTTDAQGQISLTHIGAIATGSTLAITRYTGQRYTFQKFGYRVLVGTPTMTGGDNDLSAFTPIILTAQDGLVRDQATINSATSITSFQDLLEELHVLSLGLTGSASYSGAHGGNLFTYAGGVLTTSFTTVNVDATAASKISFNSATNTLTIKASVLTDTVDVQRWNNTTGSINLQNGAAIEGVYQSSAGTSTTLELRGVAEDSSIYIGNESTGVTTLFQSDVAAGTYRAYFAPGVTAPQLIARELYGYQRESEVIPLTGGLIWYQFIDVPDVGVVQPTLATVQAYTSVENADKFYDRTAAFRLTEQGIKLGQITTRNGTTIDVSAPYSVVIDQSAASVYGISGDTITLKATGYANGSVYTNTVLIPPATLEADTNEVLSADFEDANGDSAVTILGGDGDFELWKVTTATPTANYTSGTKLADVGNEKYRFTGLSGYDIVGVDINSNVRRRTSMAKGIYTQSFYVGDQIQLAQAPQVIDNGLKLDLLAVEIEALQTNSLTLPEIEASTILAKEVTVRQAKRKAALAAALSA
jgi:hypothetical protein